MSGGYAYVLDLDRSLVNGELVEVEAVDEDSSGPLREVVAAHAAHTDSAVAHALLADWPAARSRFSAIVPRDFRRALEATRTARANGEDVDEAVMAAARA
jgi:glutamate synthase (NADPH/NADH) large chain